LPLTSTEFFTSALPALQAPPPLAMPFGAATVLPEIVLSTTVSVPCAAMPPPAAPLEPAAPLKAWLPLIVD